MPVAAQLGWLKDNGASPLPFIVTHTLTHTSIYPTTSFPPKITFTVYSDLEPSQHLGTR